MGSFEDSAASKNQFPQIPIPVLSSNFFRIFVLLIKKTPEWLQNAKLGQEIKLNSWWSWVRFCLTSLNMRCPISAKYVMVSCADSAGMINWTLDISSDRKRSIRTIIKKNSTSWIELQWNIFCLLNWLQQAQNAAAAWSVAIDIMSSAKSKQ